PQRLQRMLFKLQKYNLKVVYKRGKEMYIADTLSRAPEKKTEGTGLTQLEIYKICEEIEQLDVNQHLNVTAERIKETQMLVKVIQKGWPEKKEQVPVEIREYWHYRDELSPHMSSEIRDKVAKCAYCNETKNKQINQPMLTHPIPTRPWQRVAMDLFEYKAQQWIVMTDYYSDYWETKKLKSTTAEN
ncbi:hypothetical protein CBL_21445, partial [Carabus blaptoides fortunei]